MNIGYDLLVISGGHQNRSSKQVAILSNSVPISSLITMETLPQLFEYFCDYKFTLEGNTPRTIKWYEEVFRLFLKFNQITNYKELTRFTFEKWLHNGRKGIGVVK
ncbi:MAG: hypothetical protein JKX84_10705 [Flavobacteriales bacterium]|nr:hypothetical protein [Flavobacteriales bacterium]